MAKVIIDGKEHSCSKVVKEEIEMLRINLKTFKRLCGMIVDKQEEIDDFVLKKESEIQNLLNQLINF